MVERMPRSLPSLPLPGVLWGLVAAAAWAVYNVGAKVGAAQGFQPADLTLIRFGVAGLVMLPLLARAGLRDLGGLGWARGAALALLVGPLFGFVVNTGFVLAPLAHGVVLGPASTMLSATALARVFQGERPNRMQLAGMAILVAGLLAIAYDGLTTPAGDRVWLGDLGFIAAGALWGTFTFLLRRWRVHAVPATAAVSVLSMAVVVPLYVALDGGLLDLPARAIAVQAVYQGCLGGCLGVLAYSLAVGHLGASRAALFPSFVPVLATLLAMPMLGQVPDALQGAGILLASLGLLTALDLFAPRPVPAGDQ